MMERGFGPHGFSIRFIKKKAVDTCQSAALFLIIQNPLSMTFHPRRTLHVR
jgi:hypothetical protein